MAHLTQQYRRPSTGSSRQVSQGRLSDAPASQLHLLADEEEVPPEWVASSHQAPSGLADSAPDSASTPVGATQASPQASAVARSAWYPSPPAGSGSSRTVEALLRERDRIAAARLGHRYVVSSSSVASPPRRTTEMSAEERHNATGRDVAQPERAVVEAAVKDLEGQVEDQRHSAELAAEALRRVTTFIEETNTAARGRLPSLHTLSNACGELLRRTAEEHQMLAEVVERTGKGSAGEHDDDSAGAPSDASVVHTYHVGLQNGPPASDDGPSSPLIAESMPHVAEFTAQLRYIRWALTDALPKALEADAALRTGAFLQLEAQHTAIRDAMDEQKAVLSEAQAALELVAGRISAAKRDAGVLEESVGNLDRMLRDLNSEGERAALDDEFAAIQTKIDEAQVARLKARKAADVAAVEYSEACRHRDALLAEVQEEEGRLHEAERAHQRTLEAASAQEAEAAAVVAKLAAVQRDTTAAKHRAEVLQSEIAALEEEASGYDRRAREVDEQRTRVEAEARAIRSEAAGLRRDEEAAQDHAMRLRDKLAAVQSKVDSATGQRQTLRRTLVDAEADAEEAVAQAQEVEKRASYLSTLLPAHHPLRASGRPTSGRQSPQPSSSS